MSDKLQKLKEMMNLLNEGITKQDFLDNFKVVIDLIRKLQLTTKETMEKMDMQYRDVVLKIKNGADEGLIEMKEKLMKSCEIEIEKMVKEHEQMMVAMDRKIEAMKERLEEDLKPDTDAIAEEASLRALDTIAQQIPTLEAVMQELPQAGGAIRDGLELLEDEDKLKIEAIHNLRKELDEIKRMVGGRMIGGGGAVGLQNAFQIYDLSDSLDGVTKVFSVPAMTIKAITCSSNPFTMRKTIDWTHDASANTVTFTSQISADTTLASGQTVLIFYS